MTETPVPTPRVRAGSEHNLCRACDIDFGSLGSFQDHRETWRIDTKQRLVGYCMTPESLGLVNLNGTWHTEGMVAKVAKMRSGLNAPDKRS